MPENGQKVPSGFLVANHGNGFRAVRELHGLVGGRMLFRLPPTNTAGIDTHYAPLFVVNAVKW